MNEQIEGSVEFWMRAYPRRWREARGQELLGLVVDLAGPDARRLDAHTAFDLLRGGLATRLREHPPLHTWLLYRVVDRRIPVKHRSWALDDIDGFWYPMRRSGASFSLMYLMILGMNAIEQPQVPPAWDHLALFLLLMVTSMFLWPERSRRDARLKHVTARPGEPLVGGTLIAGDVLRQRTTARSMLVWATLLVGTAGVASSVAALLTPKMLMMNDLVFTPWNPGMFASWEFAVDPVDGFRIVMLAVLGSALGLGALAAVMARRRLDRLLGERPDQPCRVLRPIRATGKANVLFWALISLVLAWLEVSGRLSLGLSQLLGVGALFLLPGALVALAMTRRPDAADLAGSDVWSIAAHGRLPVVDQYAPGLWPLPTLQTGHLTD